MEHQRRKRIVPAEDRKMLAVHEAADPGPDAQVAAAVMRQTGARVLDRMPEPQTHPVRPTALGRTPDQPVIGEERKVQPRPPQQLRRSREARVALDQLRRPVPRVALELDVPQAPEPDGLEEAQTELGDIRVPLHDAVAAEAEVDRLGADLAPREVKERLVLLVELAVVSGQLVIAAGDDLRKHQLESELAQLGKAAVELAAVGDQEDLLVDAEVVGETV